MQEVYRQELIPATQVATGYLAVNCHGVLALSGRIVPLRAYPFTIPRLPKPGEIAIDGINFPDKDFRNWIKANVTGAGDSNLSQYEISTVACIDVTGYKNIKSLKGIEFFTSLKYLVCNGLDITELDVSKNTSLNRLECFNNNRLNILTVSGADALKILYCYNTGISSLDVSNNVHLNYLYAYDCDLRGKSKKPIYCRTKNKRDLSLYAERRPIEKGRRFCVHG